MSARVIIWAFHNRNRRLFYVLLSPGIAMPVTASKLGWCSTCHEVSSSDSSQRSTHMTASQMLKSSDDYVSMQCWHRFSTVRSTNRWIVFSINMQLALCFPEFRTLRFNQQWIKKNILPLWWGVLGGGGQLYAPIFAILSIRGFWYPKKS